jgi:hypothetical protein
MADIEVNIDYERLAELTAQKLFSLIKANENKPERKRIDGIKGLAEYVGCSVPTAQLMKNNKKVKAYQSGRKVFFYSDEIDNSLKK